MIEHLIYDFDGTIADSYPIFVRFVHQISEKRGIEIPCDDDTLYRALKITLRHTYDILGCEQICNYKTFADDYHALQEAYAEEFLAFPEAGELLAAAKEKGKHNYLYTHTGSVVKKMLENQGLLDHFDFILDASYGFPMKPAPDALRYLRERFDLNPQTCLMIGDRPIDAYAGMNAGMKGCLWDSDGLFEDAKVDYYIKDLYEIRRIADI